MKSFVFKINLENHHTVCTLIDNMSLEKRYHHHTLTVLDNKVYLPSPPSSLFSEQLASS